MLCTIHCWKSTDFMFLTLCVCRRAPLRTATVPSAPPATQATGRLPAAPTARWLAASPASLLATTRARHAALAPTPWVTSPPPAPSVMLALQVPATQARVHHAHPARLTASLGAPAAPALPAPTAVATAPRSATFARYVLELWSSIHCAASWFVITLACGANMQVGCGSVL